MVDITFAYASRFADLLHGDLLSELETRKRGRTIPSDATGIVDSSVPTETSADLPERCLNLSHAANGPENERARHLPLTLSLELSSRKGRQSIYL